MTINKNKKNRYTTISLTLFVIVVSVIKAYSIFNYSMYQIDEEHVVQYAVGFLDFDFNPRWFGYHTLPMYLLSGVYFIVYCIYYTFGFVTTKAEFVSLLFFDNSVYFIVGRLVFSIAYSIGCLVLSKIIYDRYHSAAAAILFFVASNIFPESIQAANIIRVDTFVFMFMALTIYYGCYAEKTTKSYILSVAMCAAAFASKLPAIAMFPVLALSVLFHVFKDNYRIKHIYCLMPTYGIMTFAFMPFAFLDYKSYYPVVGDIINRSSGNHYHIGKVHNFTLAAKLERIYSLVISQVGILCVSICIIGIYFIVRKHEHLFALLFSLSYTSIFTTSLTVDSYWLIPIYPIILFLVLITLCESLVATPKYIKAKQVTLAGISSLVILLYLLIINWVPLCIKVNAVLHASEDVRIISGKWIHDNMPDKATVWLDGHIPFYNPRIVTKDKGKDLLINGYWGISEKNKLITEGYEEFLKLNRHNYTKANINFIGPGELSSKFSERAKYFKKGDFVVINSRTYRRYSQNSIMQGLEKVAQEAQLYYAVIRKQRHLKTFDSNGSIVEIYEIISTVDQQ